MAAAGSSRDALHLPQAYREMLDPYLPVAERDGPAKRGNGPFVTLTFATSLDSMLALRPGAPTALSGPLSKAATHYLRSRHDAILIGVGTAEADDPSLNCRLSGVGGYGGEGLSGQPRPVVLDPSARWRFTERSKLFALVANGRGRAPLVLTGTAAPPADRTALLTRHGGKYVHVKMRLGGNGQRRVDWSDAFEALKREGISSVMVEGGACVINSLLSLEAGAPVDSCILTIAPTWLGRGGVVVAPNQRQDGLGRPAPAARLKDVQWHAFEDDMMLCGRLEPYSQVSTNT